MDESLSGIHRYAGPDIAADLRAEIVEFVAAEWPEWVSRNHLAPGEIHLARYEPQHVVLLDRGRLMSHACILHKVLRIDDQVYSTAGLGHVFTLPEMRRRGCGHRVVRAATEEVGASGADLAVLTCRNDLVAFYGRCGWEPMPSLTLLEPSGHSPSATSETAMMLFLSRRGEAMRKRLNSARLIFGGPIW